MQTSRNVLAACVLAGALSACSSYAAHGGDGTDRPAPKSAASASAGALPAGRPANPPQYARVAEADWNLSKPAVGAELPCRNGKVRIFDCQATSLLAFLPVDSIGGGSLNDLWGWTDTATGREFALVGRTTGTSFVEITDPLNPRYLGQLPFHAGSKPSIWRDIKVYKNYAFIVSEGRDHGMQVFDLTQLRRPTSSPVTFQETAHYDSIASVHNLVIDEATGYAYTVGGGGGGETCGSGLYMIDIHDPPQPKFAGCYAEARTGRAGTGYVHDAECTIYHGPDRAYDGHEICFNAAETAVSVADVTDKKNPKTLSIVAYPNVGYTHQGWLSTDQRYFFLGDEADEGEGRMTRTIVFDMRDLDDPVVAKEFFGTTTATDHNLYVRGRYMYQSNYDAGLRVIDIADPKNPKEVGYFHSPEGSSWSNYPYFARNADVVVFTSGRQGLFIVRHRPLAGR